VYVTIHGQHCTARIMSYVRIIDIPRRERAINVDTNAMIKIVRFINVQ